MRRSLYVVALLLVASGCGSSSFVGRRLDNFTAYYNTFYNARRSFEEGVKASEKQSQAIDRDRYLPLFAGAERAANPKAFDDAVRKSADVLRTHERSKWVDDALLLIGKSYFYQQNFVGAEQKFREVIGLGTKLQDEARFWLARTLIAAASYDAAAAHLTESLAREGVAPRWQARLRLAQGELHVERGEWEAAAEALAQGLRRVGDADLAARAQFLLGQVLETMGRYPEAVAAYERVRRYKPVYELSYAAQVSAILVEGQHGDARRALSWLRRMERDDKHYQNRSELAYLRGRIYQAQRRADDAFVAYDQLLYNSDAQANVGAIRGRVHYALGELYRDLYRDYLLASAHFDTAAVALQGTQGRGGGRAAGGAGGGLSPGSQAADNPLAYTPSAIRQASQVSQMFKSFAAVRTDIARMDSLLHLGSLDEAAYEAAVVELRKRRAAEIEAQRREQARRQAEQGFQNGGNRLQQQQQQQQQGGAGGAAGGPGGDGGGGAGSETVTAGFLFHKNAIRVQEGWETFVDRWGERPLVPNWRREEAVRGALAEADSAGGERFEAFERDADALPEVDLSAVPRDPDSQARMRAARAAARYELGNVLFLSMARPDSAAAWYRMVIEEDSAQAVAPRAYYALAEVQRSLGDTLSARRLYVQVLNAYPESEFAPRIRERLGMPVEEQPPADTLALADRAYDAAYAAWRGRRYEEALRGMLELAARYPTVAVAPRALLAAGTIGTEWAAAAGLDPLAALPVAVPDTLVQAAGLPEVKPVAVPADSAAAAPGLAAADSLGAPADSVAAPAVPAPAPGLTPLRVEMLYAGVVAQYPKTPFAERARSVLEALGERRRAIDPADTTWSAHKPAAPPQRSSTPVRPRRRAGDDTLPNDTRRATTPPPVNRDPAEEQAGDTEPAPIVDPDALPEFEEDDPDLPPQPPPVD